MSTAAPSPIRPRNWFSGTSRTAVLTWAIVIAIASAIGYITSRQNTALRQDLSRTQNAVEMLTNDIETADPVEPTEVGGLKKEIRVLAERLAGLEKQVGGDGDQLSHLEEKASEAESQRAVERAKVVDLAGQAAVSRGHLEKLKTLQADWEAKFASLRAGESGRRIAASPPHLDLLTAVLEQDRPTPEQIQRWQLELDELAAPLQQSLKNKKEDSLIAIKAEHAQMLTDLGQQLSKSHAEFERQHRLVDALIKETTAVDPHSASLDDVLSQRRQSEGKAREQRVLAALQAARKEAEEAQAEHLKQLQRAVIDAETKRQEAKLQAEKDQIARLTKLEQEQIAEETRAKEAQGRATIAGISEKAERVDEALRLAQLERDFQRDLPDIRGYLSAFTAIGYRHREDNTKGPMSLTYIKGQGALAPDLGGLQKLMSLASASNDRPRGALPYFIGGDLRSAGINTSPLEKAQELLRKYGELMVTKGMLAK